MSDRYDLLTAREDKGKTYFTRIGVMFPNKNGDGFNIILEALPIPQPDGCRVIAKRPQPRDGARSGGGSRDNGGWDADAPF